MSERDKIVMVVGGSFFSLTSAASGFFAVALGIEGKAWTAAIFAGLTIFAALCLVMISAVYVVSAIEAQE